MGRTARRHGSTPGASSAACVSAASLQLRVCLAAAAAAPCGCCSLAPGGFLRLESLRSPSDLLRLPAGRRRAACEMLCPAAAVALATGMRGRAARGLWPPQSATGSGRARLPWPRTAPSACVAGWACTDGRDASQAAPAQDLPQDQKKHEEEGRCAALDAAAAAAAAAMRVMRRAAAAGTVPRGCGGGGGVPNQCRPRHGADHRRRAARDAARLAPHAVLPCGLLCPSDAAPCRGCSAHATAMDRRPAATALCT
jgi:hypothetical protein